MNNKEWLEEIKNGYFEYVLGTPWVSMPKERLGWLIQQVEQLEKENKRYRKALEEISNADLNSEGLDAERELDKVTDVAIKALEDLK